MSIESKLYTKLNLLETRLPSTIIRWSNANNYCSKARIKPEWDLWQLIFPQLAWFEYAESPDEIKSRHGKVNSGMMFDSDNPWIKLYVTSFGHLSFSTQALTLERSFLPLFLEACLRNILSAFSWSDFSLQVSAICPICQMFFDTFVAFYESVMSFRFLIVLMLL